MRVLNVCRKLKIRLETSPLLSLCRTGDLDSQPGILERIGERSNLGVGNKGS